MTASGTNQPAPGPGQAPAKPAGSTAALLLRRCHSWLATPVSGASLAACRIALGIVTVLEVYSLCNPSQMVSGRIPAQNYFVGPDIHFNFPYAGLEWLPSLPAPWFYCLLALTAVFGFTMAIGLLYRVSAAAVFLTTGYLFAVESTRTYWQSYYYIELLFAFLIVWMPAARRFSVDAWLSRNKARPQTVPFWTLLLLRSQLVVMYFYGGVAKLNADWLQDAAPLRWALREAHVGTVFEPFLSAAQLALVKAFLHDLRFAYFLSYAGVLFDLAIGFLLLIRRTRILGIILMAVFHATNHFLIYDNIDWFPLVGLTTALIFLEPDWPERFWNWLRRPVFVKPDWAWLVTGAVLVPGIGAALGWKFKPSASTHRPIQSPPLAPFTLPFVALWLVWQTLFPLRHYLIPGDGRITYEGLSFSWRLKTDEHNALSPVIVVRDSKIILSPASDRGQVDWNEWRGDKVLYRAVKPARIDWRQLPEIVVLLEPMLGYRMVYNPFSGAATPRTEAESRARVGSIWNELYGRSPAGVWPLASLPRVLHLVSGALKKGGNDFEAQELERFATESNEDSVASSGRPPEPAINRGKLVALLKGLVVRDTSTTTISFLRLLSPFSLELGRSLPGDFLAIDDPLLLDRTQRKSFRPDPALWKSGSATRNPGSRLEPGSPIEPLIIHLGDLATEAKILLPQACVFDSLEYPDRAPYIFWNTLRDVNTSKQIHIANQPFYLRRYARRVAELWEKQYGRRPAITATTAVSLNHRPYQAIVDPNADLASVPAAWFRHNPWIRDLETRRIPAETLTANSTR